MTDAKKQHGGARQGAGRPKADREDTKIVSFRLPTSQLEVLEAVAGHHDVTVHSLCRSLVVAALNICDTENGNIADICYREAARGDAHIRPSDDPALQGKLEKLWEELHDEQRRGVASLCTKK